MRVYTTGEIAKICQVAPTTVNKWVDSGKLKGFRVPGSRHRRIPQSNFRHFLNTYDIGVIKPTADGSKLGLVKILLVSRDDQLVAGLSREQPGANGNCRIESARGAFECGEMATDYAPDIAVVDFKIGDIEAGEVLQGMSNEKKFPGIYLIALTLPGNAERLPSHPAIEVFSYPFDLELLAARIGSLASEIRHGLIRD